MIGVAHVVLGMQVGGLERVVANLAQAFRGTDFRVSLVCLEEGGPLAEDLKHNGLPVTVLGKKPGIDWTCVLRLSRWLRKENIQIVHTHNPVPHFHGIAAALLAGVPVRVHTKHGRNYPNNPRRVFLYRLLSRFTDMIIPVSDNARDVALHVEKVAPVKVRRIWNGVDTGRYAPADRFQVSDVACQATAQNAEAPGSFTIGTVARLSPEKDQGTMLEALALVHKQLPHARLVLVGDGPSRAGLEEKARALGITCQVDFLGMRSDISTQLSKFDIFTLSSITEGISMTILEAMACQVPIVATDVGGNREIVQPPQCGLIVPARDPQALAAAYLELLQNPSRRAEMGVAGRQRVLAHFSLEAMAGQYAALYRELLAHKGVPSSNSASCVALC